MADRASHHCRSCGMQQRRCGTCVQAPPLSAAATLRGSSTAGDPSARLVSGSHEASTCTLMLSTRPVLVCVQHFDETFYYC